jgi:hypothetical protein
LGETHHRHDLRLAGSCRRHRDPNLDQQNLHRGHVHQDDSDPTKQAQFQASGITAGQTRTYTLPNASTTLVGTAFAQSISNKDITISTISDSDIFILDTDLEIVDNSDLSKTLKFECSGISSLTTRTLTVPDASGTIALTSHVHAIDDLSDVAISTARAGSVLAYDGSDWSDHAVYSHMLGPFLFPDLTGTGTPELKPIFYDTTTSSKVNTTRRFVMSHAGYVVGIHLMSDDARSAGTAIASVLVNGVSQAFNSDSVVLDGTNTTQNSDYVHPTAGVSFAADDQLSVRVTTSGWTPTTANVAAYLIVQLTPFD